MMIQIFEDLCAEPPRCGAGWRLSPRKPIQSWAPVLCLSTHLYCLVRRPTTSAIDVALEPDINEPILPGTS